MSMTMHALQKTKQPLSFFTESVADLNAVNFWLQKFNPLWSSNQALAKVVHKEMAAADLVSLTLLVNRHFKFGEAGQHHPVFITINGVRYERTYSLTKLDQQHVQLIAKKVESGKASTWLTEQVKEGDILEFGLPFGDMTVPADMPLVLLAAGSGITPMFSMLNALKASGQLKAQPVQLLYWVKRHEDAAFKGYFEQLAKTHENFSFKIFYTQADEADARLNDAHASAIADLSASTVYACGPSGFAAKAEELFAHAAKAFQSEAFSMSMAVYDDIGFVNVTLTQSNKVLSIPKGQSILASLEQQNIKPAHGCRMGICNKCVCNKAEGATKNLLNGAQNAEPGNALKICVNSAQSDLVIDL